MNNSYIIFDGECGFCNKTAMFIAKNNKNDNFKLVSSLSDFGTTLLTKHKINGLETSTIISVENDSKIYIKSTAVKKILLKIPLYNLLGYTMLDRLH